MQEKYKKTDKQFQNAVKSIKRQTETVDGIAAKKGKENDITDDSKVGMRRRTAGLN